MLARMDLQAFASLGGKARAAKLSKSQLSEIGRKASCARWQKRSTLPLDASETKNHIQVAKPEPRRCQSSFCTNEGREVNVHGLKAWLCSDHG